MADIQVDYMLPVKGWALVGGLGFVGNQAAWLDSCSQRAGPVWWVHLEEQEEAEQQASLGKTGRERILNILRNKKGSKTLSRHSRMEFLLQLPISPKRHHLLASPRHFLRTSQRQIPLNFPEHLLNSRWHPLISPRQSLQFPGDTSSQLAHHLPQNFSP